MKTMKARNAKGAYWMKRILPMVALVAVGLMTACHDDKPNIYPERPIDPVKVLPFGDRVGFDSLEYDNVMKYANDPRIITIIYFLDSTNGNNNCTGYNSRNISNAKKYLQEHLDYTPKATGAGTFIFLPNEASVEDSLWFIANGWKIRTR